jgi:hypothetical protein
MSNPFPAPPQSPGLLAPLSTASSQITSLAAQLGALQQTVSDFVTQSQTTNPLLAAIPAQMTALQQQLAALAPQVVSTDQYNQCTALAKQLNDQLTAAKSGKPVTAPGGAPGGAPITTTTTSAMSPEAAGALGVAVGAALGSFGTYLLSRSRRKGRR